MRCYIARCAFFHVPCSCLPCIKAHLDLIRSVTKLDTFLAFNAFDQSVQCYSSPLDSPFLLRLLQSEAHLLCFPSSLSPCPFLTPPSLFGLSLVSFRFSSTSDGSDKQDVLYMYIKDMSNPSHSNWVYLTLTDFLTQYWISKEIHWLHRRKSWILCINSWPPVKFKEIVRIWTVFTHFLFVSDMECIFCPIFNSSETHALVTGFPCFPSWQWQPHLKITLLAVNILGCIKIGKYITTNVISIFNCISSGSEKQQLSNTIQWPVQIFVRCLLGYLYVSA